MILAPLKPHLRTDPGGKPYKKDTQIKKSEKYNLIPTHRPTPERREKQKVNIRRPKKRQIMKVKRQRPILDITFMPGPP
ncbi:hypothetical protein MSHOH_2608 [Methanosarcina horonobensis HB-1 = JCM 15518]|uniref:Uncharacterized protein n=1 Tax=Methanosarcina horonobensis HB-1 = JCM 15518 TaxID=1434110 RepID=A0A0E3SDX8_9EURY|nr:hypothetical protein [Methanosarcina horonobensis]AKB79091.1 hypothetical protein MSHOH_2608 [Methanosarcina horonobensis HB-1 = JCM 15518]